VLDHLIRAAGREDEQYILHWLLLRLSGHQVELTRILSAAFPELARRVPSFFQHRVKDYRRAMRMRKLLGFKSARSIEEEAVRRAWEDTRAMMAEVSVLRDDTLKRLVNDHRAILRRLAAALLKLVLEQPGARIELDREAFRKFLEGS
jgi:hypothetical protein